MDALGKSFVQYYLRELSMLEDDCAEFSAAYPQVAGNLGLSGEGATDPHVRQLIESVAFIAARLKRQIDSVPGELALGVLQSVAPHLAAPVPSMAVARFFPLTDQLDAEAVPAGSLRLSAASGAGECLFTGCAQDVSLWPLELACPLPADPALKVLVNAAPADAGEFVLKLAHPGKKHLRHGGGGMTFFISGALSRALAAVEALALGLLSVRMVALDGSWTVPVSREQVDVLGFEPGHRLIASPRDDQVGALALEFLNFPRRFCFVKISGLQCPQPASGFFLVFTVRRPWLAALEAVREHVHLNCVPIVNMFERPPVLLQLKDACGEYLLPRGDMGRGRWDVFGVRRVRLMERDKRYEVREFHAGLSDGPGPAGDVFWQGVRRERTSPGVGHASLALRFIGLDYARARGRSGETAMVETSCTNCDAPESLQAGQPLTVHGWDTPYRARLELVPTPYVGAILPTDPAIAGMSRALEGRTGRACNIAQAVRRYLAVHDRTHSAHASAAVTALSEIGCEAVAMPRPDAPPGAMLSLGYRYRLAFRKGDDLFGSRYLFARLVSKVLAQLHDAPLPMEVLSDDGRGEVFHVG